MSHVSDFYVDCELFNIRDDAGFGLHLEHIFMSTLDPSLQEQKQLSSFLHDT